MALPPAFARCITLPGLSIMDDEEEEDEDEDPTTSIQFDLVHVCHTLLRRALALDIPLISLTCHALRSQWRLALFSPLGPSERAASLLAPTK